MLSLSLFINNPTMNTINIPWRYRQKTPSSVPRVGAQSRKTIFEKSSQNSSCPFRFRLAAAGGDSAGYHVNEEDKSVKIIDLPEGLKPELMPKHVAVIMDGNRRWARNRKLPVEFGYKAGGDAMKQLFLNCERFGVKVLTVFAFSTENWVRPKEEVDLLMRLFEEVVKAYSHMLNRNNLQLSIIGNTQRLPESLQSQLSSTEVSLKGNKGLRLVAALNYSGQYDITEASKRIATKVRDGVLRVEDINEHLFEQHLETNNLEYPNPDLVIRTSGEQRISNFMLWQLAYTEMYFSNKLFPDFGEDDFIGALKDFQRRQRRYGGHKYPKQE